MPIHTGESIVQILHIFVRAIFTIALNFRIVQHTFSSFISYIFKTVFSHQFCVADPYSLNLDPQFLEIRLRIPGKNFNDQNLKKFVRTSYAMQMHIFLSCLQEGIQVSSPPKSASALKNMKIRTKSRSRTLHLTMEKKSKQFYLQEIKELDAEEVPGFVLVNGRSLTDILREYVG
jgi:hypothetical protein